MTVTAIRTPDDDENQEPAHRGLLIDPDQFFAKAGDRRFQILDIDQQDQIPDPRWLVEGWLPLGGLNVIYGPPSAAKTFFALSLALSAVTGKAFFGNRVLEQCDILYLAGEGASGIKLRRQAWQHHNGLSNEDVAGFQLMGESAQLNHERDVSALLVAISRLRRPPKIIFIDTLHRYYDGDENSSQDAAAFIRACELLEKATGASVVVLHHSNANGTKERGSTAFRGDANFTIRLDHEEGAPVRTASVVKVKDGKTPAPITFQLLDVMASAVPVRADGGAAAGYGQAASYQAPSRPSVPGLGGGFGGGGAAAVKPWNQPERPF